jgi:hypothetical protein
MNVMVDRPLTTWLLVRKTPVQAKMQRLSGNAPAVAAASELLDALRVENAELQADNERLLAYAESLETPGAGSGGASLLLSRGLL